MPVRRRSDAAAIARMSKVELHQHVDGSIPPSRTWALMKRHGLNPVATRAQMVRMYGVSTTWDVFCALLIESFRHHGDSFVLLSKQLVGVPGLSRANRKKILQQLERRGLIAVTRRPSKPPLIKVVAHSVSH